MKSSHKIRVVTCCYCGARSTLEQTRTRNLICHGCGASIQRLEGVQPVLERSEKKHRKKPAVPHPAESEKRHLPKDRPVRRRKGKRRRGMWYHVREAFDDLDDIFDVFD
ncbi:MAG: hypothetical protein AAF293_08640 [Pseudomonadota bacterium]